MLSPRPCNLYLALRRLTIFCLSLGLTNSAVLTAQTNSSSGNHTTSGSSHGSNNTSGSTGNHTSGGASQGSSSGTSVGTSSGSKGGTSSGSGASSAGNSSGTGLSGAGASTGFLGRRGRSEGSSSGGNTSGGAGYPALPTEFIYDNASQSPVLPSSGLFATARPSPVTSGQAVGAATPVGQNASQATPGSSPVVVVGPAGSLIASTTKLGFEPAEVSGSEVALAIAERLRRLPALHFVTPVRVDLDGRTAILRGTVASGHDRDLAQRVVLLESAVDEVINLLEVAGHTDTKNPPPPQPRT